MSLPWKYIRLDELMSSVKSDLSLYDDSGMIDEDRVLKVIAACNEKLGQRIYKSRECKLQVRDYIADIPNDLYKIENILATQVYTKHNHTPDFGAQQVDFAYEKPKDPERIITYGQMGCVDTCNQCYWITDRKTPIVNQTFVYEKFIPLQLSNSLYGKCAEYAPCSNTSKDYTIDLDNDTFKFSFKEGEIYLCYLGNLVDEDGNLLIPFHPKLNDYYEYAVKEKILEDMYLNSEADVIQKLQYITAKKREAYAIAWDFANTREVNEWSKIQKKLQTEYYNKWYKMYN